MDELKGKLEKHRYHIRKLETLLRMLDNMSVEVNTVSLILHCIMFFENYYFLCQNILSGIFKGGNRFKKGFFLMIFMIFFDNKGMNIIYLYFVNILYIYLRRNCEIFKFFFLRNMEDIGCCPSNVSVWSRYFRTFWKPQILSEINKVPNLASSHIWFLCEPNFTKRNRKFNFLWVCKDRKSVV